MKHKTWFRLVIKAIGLLMIGQALPTVAMAIGQALLYVGMGTMSPLGVNLDWARFVWLVGPALQFALGVYCFFGGNWIVNRCIPSNRPYCPDCGYDLSRSRGERCPECGVVLPSEIAQREITVIDSSPPPRA